MWNDKDKQRQREKKENVVFCLYLLQFCRSPHSLLHEALQFSIFSGTKQTHLLPVLLFLSLTHPQFGSDSLGSQSTC